MLSTTLPADFRSDVEMLWDYNQMHHDLVPTELAIGLGGHDLGVADYCAELYHQTMVRRVVFTGANAPTTLEKFPRGEAVHFRERALELGVPDEAILVEPRATNTGDNIDFTRALLRQHGIVPSSVTLVSRPYQQRRSFAICRKRWPEVDVVCASRPLPLDVYIESIGDVDRVINMLVGDTQRIWTYPRQGWAIEQIVPGSVHAAFERLVDAGFTSRLVE